MSINEISSLPQTEKTDTEPSPALIRKKQAGTKKKSPISQETTKQHSVYAVLIIVVLLIFLIRGNDNLLRDALFVVFAWGEIIIRHYFDKEQSKQKQE